MTVVKADRRREAGQRTRTRLLDAAIVLLADRGEEGVTLRGLTDAAEANVAAVSYHFGSLKSLCDEAVEQALERYLDAQQESVGALGSDSTVEEVAAAFARPMVMAMADEGRDLAVLRIVARVGIDPPEGWGRFDKRFVRIRTDVVGLLKPNIGDATVRELLFRTRCAAGLLNWLALAPVGADLIGKPWKQIERRVVPVLAGVFRGV